MGETAPKTESTSELKSQGESPMASDLGVPNLDALMADVPKEPLRKSTDTKTKQQSTLKEQRDTQIGTTRELEVGQTVDRKEATRSIVSSLNLDALEHDHPFMAKAWGAVSLAEAGYFFWGAASADPYRLIVGAVIGLFAAFQCNLHLKKARVAI